MEMVQKISNLQEMRMDMAHIRHQQQQETLSAWLTYLATPPELLAAGFPPPELRCTKWRRHSLRFCWMANFYAYFNDSIAIGSFHAIRNGILTSSTSAGNDGLDPSTITNFAPSFISVAASTMDQKFSTKVLLGNNETYEGISINTFDLHNITYPLIYGRDAANTTGGFTNVSSSICEENSLDRNLVKGKIVLCDTLDSRKEPFNAGAAGALIRGETHRDTPLSFPLPTSYVNINNGNKIFLYINSTRYQMWRVMVFVILSL
ncbi:cucumisin-like [Melia azedarach]|uniref:Cucumisin-like n=1 Tax=Melia azedarach TaxID=155640 RepID=A0ACC1Y9L6_MELAZ|nr:cucumisin-like [Melia azedarach]